MHRLPARRTAFTMIELVIVIVVLGLLAGVGVIAYGSVVSTSQDRAASLALTDVAREASALAAQNGETEWSEDDWTTALADTSAGPALSGSGVSAAGKLTLVNTAADSTNSSSMGYGQVSLQTRPGGVAGLAMKAASGHCVFVRAVLPQQITAWKSSSDLGGNCLASVGLDAGPGGSYSYTATVTAGATPLAPTGVGAALVGGSVSVTWNPVDGASTYTLYRSVDGGAHWSVALSGLRFAGTSDTTATAAGTTYTYAVTASATNESPKSAPASVTLVPAAPSGLAQTSATSSSVTLGWTAPGGADSFAVFRDGAATPLQTGITGTTFTDTGLVPGASHTYTVVAHNAGGDSPTSSAVTAAAVPPAPTGATAAMPSWPYATISWNPTPGATSYTVTVTARNLSSGAVGSHVVGTATGTSFTDQVWDGYAETWSVTASNAGGTSAASAPTATLQGTIAPDTAPAQGSNPNLLANGGFEGGTGWSSYIPSGSFVNYVLYTNSTLAAGSHTYEGNTLAAINVGSGGGSIYHDIPTSTVAGGKYCISAEVVTQNSASEAYGTLTLWNQTAGPTNYEAGNVNFSHLPGDANWLRVSTCVTASVNGAGLRAEMYGPGSPTTLFLDDVRVWKAN